MPTLNALPPSIKVPVFPGDAPLFTFNWDVTNSLTGRTFSGRLNGETLTVNRSGQVLTVTFPASITAVLPSRSQFVLYETTGGMFESRVAFDVVTSRNGTSSATTDTVTVNVDTFTVDVTVIGGSITTGGGGGGDLLSTNNLSDVANTTTARANILTGMTSAQLAGYLTDETGTGAAVFATSPTLVTPALGTPSAVVLTNATGLPVSTGISGLGTGVATFLGTPSSANLAAALTDETGSGAAVFATSPTLVTPALGTPSSAVLTNATGLPISTGVSGLGTGVATFLATPSSANLRAALTDETGTGAAVFATSPALVTPDLGTPSAATLTNATGLPISTGVAGLGTGVATFLATPSSANLRAALTDESGTGAAIFADSPTFTTQIVAPTIYGSTASGGGLTLEATSNGTDGTVVVLGDITDASIMRVGNSSTGATAALEVNGGGGLPIHVCNAFSGLSFVATQFNGGKSSVDLRSTQGASLASLANSLAGDVLGAIHIGGSHDSALVDCAHNYWYAQENFGDSTTASGTSFLMALTPAGLGSDTKFTALTVYHDGGIIAGAPDTVGGGSASRTISSSALLPGCLFGLRSTQTLTSDYSAARSPFSFSDQSTRVWTTAGNSSAAPFVVFNAQATLKNTNGVAAHLSPSASGVGASAFRDVNTVEADGATINLGNYNSFRAQPIVTVINSGAWNASAIKGFTFLPSVTGGTLGTATGLSIEDFTPSGGGAVTTYRGIDIGALSGGSTNVGIRSAAPVRLSMATSTLTIGADQAASSMLDIIQSTVGNEVMRLVSTATNDDPIEQTFQARAATTDATVTTLASYSLTASMTHMVRAYVTARRTGGSSGTAEDGAGYVLSATFQGAAQIGTTTVVATHENQAGWDATLDYSANTFRIRVTGAANNNVTWHVTYRVYKVGT